MIFPLVRRWHTNKCGSPSAPERIVKSSRIACAASAHLVRCGTFPNSAAPTATISIWSGDVLAKGKTSRLYKRLVYDDQIATAVVSYADTNEIAGQFAIQGDGASRTAGR